MCRFDVTRVPLAADPASVGEARKVVDELLCGVAPRDVRETALLLVSEIVTNAITHGEPPVVLEVCAEADSTLEVRVSDAGGGLPQVHRARPEEDHGRGMAITAALSGEWGVRPERPGKTVWFRLGTHPGVGPQ